MSCDQTHPAQARYMQGILPPTPGFGQITKGCVHVADCGQGDAQRDRYLRVNKPGHTPGFQRALATGGASLALAETSPRVPGRAEPPATNTAPLNQGPVWLHPIPFHDSLFLCLVLLRAGLDGSAQSALIGFLDRSKSERLLSPENSGQHLCRAEHRSRRRDKHQPDD